MKCVAIIPAGGVGVRFGGEVPKQFAEINSEPVLIHTLRIFEEIDDVEGIVISVHNEWFTYTKELVKKYNLNKISEIVIGGVQRQDSVMHALRTKAVGSAELVLVHDAVRPLASKELVQKVIDTAEDAGAVIPGITPKETVKEITHKGMVVKTLDRSKLSLVQTPQCFWQDIIQKAYQNATNVNFMGTDSASLVEFIGYRITVIDGEDTNIKITNPIDLKFGELLLNEKK